MGEHPSREWCQTFSHPDVAKTPVHQAAQQGSFYCLQMFLRKCPSCIIKRDGYRQTPGNIARKNQQLECFKLIVSEQFRYHKLCGFTLASYSKIMQWCYRAKERVQYYKNDINHNILLLSSELGHSSKTFLGNSMLVDGYGFKSKSKGSLNYEPRISNETKPNQVRQAKQTRPAVYSSKKDSAQSSMNTAKNAINTAKNMIMAGDAGKRRSTSANEDGVFVTDTSERKHTKVHQQDQMSTTSNVTLPSIHSGGQIKRSNSLSTQLSVRFPEIRKAPPDVDSLVYSATGMKSRQLAVKSLNLSRAFHEKSWNKTLNMALLHTSRALEGETPQLQETNDTT